MSIPIISPSERDYITKGVDENIRADGRSRSDYRQMVLETGIISQSSGSARCRLGEGTDVLISVKVEVGTVDLDVSEKQGRVACSVECSPSASPQFEGRGADELNNELTQALERVLNGPQGGLDLEALCIIPGQQCWVVYVDALILDYAGNLLDAIFVATRAALYDTLVPKTTILDLGDGQFEFEILDDTAGERLTGWKMVPVCVTLNKIGARHIIDATALEEFCTEAKLCVMVNNKGHICGVHKSADGSIEPSLLTEMIQAGKSYGQQLIKRLDRYLEAEEKEVDARRARGEPVQKLGFFAA